MEEIVKPSKAKAVKKSTKSGLIRGNNSSRINCFMCNIALKPKERSNLMPANLIAKVFINIWKLPENFFDEYQNQLQSSASFLTICKKCGGNLRRIYKVHYQMQTLLKLISKLQIEIEEIVRMAENYKDKSQQQNSQEMRSSNSSLRRKFLQGIENIQQTSTGRIHLQIENTSRAIDANSGQIKPNNKNDDTSFENITIEFAGESDSVSGNEMQGIELELELVENSEGDPIVNIHQNIGDLIYGSSDPNNPVPGGITITEEENKVDVRISCEKCQCTFMDENSKNAHYKRRHEGKRHPFSCDKCVKQFRTKSQLIVHGMTHTKETPFICEHCGKGFRMKKLLGYHLKNMHIGGREYKCTESNCFKEFLTQSKLNAHLATHSKQYLASCTICRKGFASHSLLKMHIMVKHSSLNSNRCPSCSKTFSCQSALQNHLPIHSLVFKYKCEEAGCNYGSSSKSDMDRHAFAHKDEKMFRCSHCGNEFKHKRSLIKHLRVHAGEKHFKCNTCDKSFTDNYKLQRHLNTHQDKSKPYSCNTCKKGFRTKEALKSHTRNLHAVASHLSINHNKKNKKENPFAPATGKKIKNHKKSHTQNNNKRKEKESINIKNEFVIIMNTKGGTESEVDNLNPNDSLQIFPFIPSTSFQDSITMTTSNNIPQQSSQTQQQTIILNVLDTSSSNNNLFYTGPGQGFQFPFINDCNE